MSNDNYSRKGKVNVEDFPYINYVTPSKRNDLYSQRCISKFTPTMINYIKDKINSLYVRGVGIQCKDLVDTLFNNRPERNKYEGLVLALFGLVATRSIKSNRVFYIRIADIGKTDFTPDYSDWHTLHSYSNITTNEDVRLEEVDYIEECNEKCEKTPNSVVTVEDMISTTVENVIKRKYITGNASVMKKVITNSNKASKLLHKLGKVFSSISEVLESAQI